VRAALDGRDLAHARLQHRADTVRDVGTKVAVAPDQRRPQDHRGGEGDLPASVLLPSGS
jgi:hypothetical protein